MTNLNRTLGLLPRSVVAAALLSVVFAVVGESQLHAQTSIADLTVQQGAVPRRLVGYGLVVGLDGTGDRSYGTNYGAVHTVQSVVNLLRRFNIEVPSDHLRLRTAAAVLVTAEVSPYLRAGGRFEVQVAALGDAASLRGGVLWMTPLISDPNSPPVATAQGPLVVADDPQSVGSYARRGNSGRLPEGGVMEVDPPQVLHAAEPRLVLKQPDQVTAVRIAEAINGSFGDGTATVEDPGSVALSPSADFADNVNGFLAQVFSLPVQAHVPATVIIDAREGTVVAGGTTRIGPAAVSHHGLSLQVGEPTGAGDPGSPGSVWLGAEATVQDVAAGLHAVGAEPREIAAVFESLKAAGALTARVVVR
jgi:flagellar P-ring protein precursor FlgI